MPCFDLGLTVQLRIIQNSQYVQFSYSAQLETMQTNFLIVLYFNFCCCCFCLFVFFVLMMFVYFVYIYFQTEDSAEHWQCVCADGSVC